MENKTLNEKNMTIDSTERIPNLDMEENTKQYYREKITALNLKIPLKFSHLKSSDVIEYKHFGYKDEILRRKLLRKECSLYSYCCLSVCLSFIFGLLLGLVIMSSTQKTQNLNENIDYNRGTLTRTLNSFKNDDHKSDNENVSQNDLRYHKVSFTGDAKNVNTQKYKKDIYPKGLTEDMKDILKDNKIAHNKHKIVVNKTTYIATADTVLYDNVFWGPEIENSMPQGYGENSADIWERYVDQGEVIKMEAGCGRMQNRLVTFRDGIQACVRYRQNTDQIQGEIFSFYVGRLINLTNLAPSVVKVVDLKDKLWRNVANDIANAQWNTNRAVVLTQYIPSLESATIPDIFKPSSRHLNKYDVFRICSKENKPNVVNKDILFEKIKMKNQPRDAKIDNFNHINMNLNKRTVSQFVELAQWSDLIIFDYLTANLDRIVNNLFNYQWNVNIMDGPAHNLARKMDSGLLMFLDNESGLLHGYRLLKKYNVYHSLMLDNLCVFRKTTVDSLKKLVKNQTVGSILSDLFHRKNNAVIRDILPPLPEKNSKILHDRISKVLSQVEKCEQTYR